MRRGGRAVECTGLENRRPLTGTVSSNLTLSAKIDRGGIRMMQKQVLLRDEARRSIERRDSARRRHENALRAVSLQCLPHGSGEVSDDSLSEFDAATVELRAAKLEADRATRAILRGDWS